MNMSDVKIRKEWRRREKTIDVEDEEPDGDNWMIEKNSDVIFDENVLAAGKSFKI